MFSTVYNLHFPQLLIPIKVVRNKNGGRFPKNAIFGRMLSVPKLSVWLHKTVLQRAKEQHRSHMLALESVRHNMKAQKYAFREVYTLQIILFYTIDHISYIRHFSPFLIFSMWI